MGKFLTKDIADALCTVITLGFIKYNATSGLFGNQTTCFQYSDSDPKNVKNHNDFASFLDKNLGITLSVTKTEPQSGMPCIVAKTEHIWNLQMAKDVVQDFWSYITKIGSSARDEGNAPRGAYIGGKATVSTVDIIGPSVLSPYPPEYRECSRNSNGEYQAAKKEIEAAAKILSDYPPSSSGRVIKIRHDCKYCDSMPITIKAGESFNCKCYDSMPATIKAGESFKSYHGMIRAMAAYYPPTKGDVYFEIALGVNTSKVSSCIPCSIFMSANKMAATSTHLGRGDNWAIPLKTSSLLRNAWEEAVKSHYKEGLELCGCRFQKITDMKNTLSEYSNFIPDIFLEALTFEGPFLDKMYKTLGIVQPKS